MLFKTRGSLLCLKRVAPAAGVGLLALYLAALVPLVLAKDFAKLSPPLPASGVQSVLAQKRQGWTVAGRCVRVCISCVSDKAAELQHSQFHSISSLASDLVRTCLLGSSSGAVGKRHSICFTHHEVVCEYCVAPAARQQKTVETQLVHLQSLLGLIPISLETACIPYCIVHALKYYALNSMNCMKHLVSERFKFYTKHLKISLLRGSGLAVVTWLLSPTCVFQSPTAAHSSSTALIQHRVDAGRLCLSNFMAWRDIAMGSS